MTGKLCIFPHEVLEVRASRWDGNVEGLLYFAKDAGRAKGRAAVFAECCEDRASYFSLMLCVCTFDGGLQLFAMAKASS